MLRDATLDDVNQIIECVKVLRVGSPWENSKPSMGSISMVIDSIPSGNVFFKVATFEDFVIGFMIGFLSRNLLCDEVDAYENGVFVLPKHRGGMHAVKLVKAYEKWANESGAVRIWLGQSVSHKIDKTEKFYRRLGYEITGAVSVKKGG